MNSIRADIVIVGGGLVGMAQAIAFARTGLEVVVVDRDAHEKTLQPHFDGRVSAIALGSKHLLETIGAWEYMREYAEPILHIRVTDQDSRAHVDYHYDDVGDEPMGYITENRITRNALRLVQESLPNLKLLAPAEVSSMRREAGYAELELKEGKVIRAALVIGADGKHSQIRKMADIGVVEWPYTQTAIVCTIAHEKPHGGLAQERFLPVGPFAVLPMQHNRSSLVWTEPHDLAKHIVGLPEVEFVSEIRKRVGDYLGELKLEGKRFTYPLSLMHAKRYAAHRLVLIGDAAHGIHPIAGQGVNLGWRDVEALTDIIVDAARLGLDIGSEQYLSHYESKRRLDTLAMIGATDGINRLFSNNIAPVRWLRDMGLMAVENMPPLKRVFMKHAMGVKN